MNKAVELDIIFTLLVTEVIYEVHIFFSQPVPGGYWLGQGVGIISLSVGVYICVSHLSPHLPPVLSV